MVDMKKIEEVKNKIANYISEHEDMFDYMGLKMHEAFYWVYDNAEDLATNVNNVIDYMLEYNFSPYATLDDVYNDDYADKEEPADYIINDCYNDFMEWCKPIEIVYDCIKTKKDYQVSWIEEEFRCRKEEADYEAEQEAIALAEYNKKHPLSTNDAALIMCDELLKSEHKLQIELDKNGNVKILDCILKKC